MPRRPSSSGFALSIDEDFDENKSYRVKLWDIEETEARYPGAKQGEMALVWKFNIYRDDGTAFMDTSKDEAFDQWAWSSDSTFRTSRAREYINAFVGHETTDEEVDALIDGGFREGLVGKTAIASFEIQTTADGNERLKLLLLRPDRSKSPAAAGSPARTVAAPPAQTEAETVAAAAPTPISTAAAPRARPRIDD